MLSVLTLRPATDYFCVICMEVQSAVDRCLLGCGHTFCTECVDQLLDYAGSESNARCPLCRQHLQKCRADAKQQV